MKSKTGFTLVELLAVIAILAILVIIALPNVLEMFNNAKKSTFTTEVQNVYKQAQTDFINDSLTSSGPKYYCSDEKGNKDGSSADNCKKLQLTTTKDYVVEMNSTGTVTYLGVQDKSFVYGKRNVKSIDGIWQSDVVDSSEKESFNITSHNTTAVAEVKTFKVGDSNFSFEEGMTFGDWVDSKYNTTGAFKVNYAVYFTYRDGTIRYEYLDDDKYTIGTAKSSWYCDSNFSLTSMDAMYNGSRYVYLDDEIDPNMNYYINGHMC